MRMRVNCKQIFENSQWILLTSGLWLTPKLTASAALKIIFNLLFNVIVSTVICQNVVNAIKENNIKFFNGMVCVFVGMLTYFTKSLSIMINKQCFYSILLDLESRTFNTHSDKLNGHIRNVYRISKLVQGYFVMALAIYMSVGSLLPFFLNIGYIIPPPANYAKHAVVYKLAHFFATGYLAFNTIGLDTLFLSLLSLCVAQLNILEGKLAVVLEDAKRNIENEREIKLRIRFILKEIVILHERINQYTQKLSTLLSFPLFIQYACGCFVLCNTVVQLTILREPGSVHTLSMCAYAGVMFAEMAAYHFLGNEIMYKSDKIIESTYISEWYQLDYENKMTLLLLMERAKKPLIVKLYNFIFISLGSLGVVGGMVSCLLSIVGTLSVVGSSMGLFHFCVDKSSISLKIKSWRRDQ